MGLSIQLVDTRLTGGTGRRAKAKGGRKAGRAVVSDIVDHLPEDGELRAVLAAAGRDTVPTMARVDPYDDTEFDHYFCELALAELDRVSGLPLPAPEREFVNELGALFRRALAEPAYAVRFVGD
ncbi:hypothetical protein ACIRS1_02220 [Kitasatospora sp. NPDC101176]|uniref:hypothetical protein n=1 Tax=Kitasatospora sp. NPDC101176 TaxID=3364099 RepID=UPI00381B1D9E